MPHQSEAALENSLIEKLAAGGYEKVVLNGTQGLEANFRRQLEKHNRTAFSDEEFKKIRTHLDGGSVFVRAQKLRDRYELHRPEGVFYVSFLNLEQWCRNRFQVTSQLTNRQGRYVNRYDVTLLINGLPLAQIELKRRGLEIKEAFNQALRYKKDSLFTGLFNYIQLFVISNGVNTRYFANNHTIVKEQIFHWTKEDNTRLSTLEAFAEHFLERCHLAKMITRYIVLNHTRNCLMALRPYQYYAVESIVKKVEETTGNGYVWHTTGSGKTLTSFKTAQLLQRRDTVDKVLFVVDRKDLDHQTTKEFNHFSRESVEGTEDTKSLVKQLAGRNKLVITTIQKLTNAIKRERYSKEMEEAGEKKCVFIFDECHRSQFGEMHKLITGHFTRHQCFGFTGTPILAENANKGRTTTDLFGECLHKYVIKDAINDDNVLGFAVEYFATYLPHKDIEEEEVEGIDTDEVMEHPDRLNLIVDHIIRCHKRKTFNKEFTALFAVSNIGMLIKYYDTFKKRNHGLRIAAIFSFGVNEDPQENNGEELEPSSRDKLEEFMADYNALFGANFTTKTPQGKANKGGGYRGRADDFNAYYIDVSRRVKEREIDILLVVNMFLTGFDSPRLNTLYVDKNLQYQGLVQAFSRTNRLYSEKKKHGNIVCFRNLKKKTDEAIILYSNAEALDTVITEPYEKLLKKFNDLLTVLHGRYPNLKAVDALTGDEAKLAFIELFRNILRLKAALATFTEFTFDDTSITEQRFEDFTGKYRDLYDEVMRKKRAEKVSILDDIDFEIELLRRDDINVDYIIELLKGLRPEDEKKKEFILTTVKNSVELKSKRELIERFIESALVPGGDVEADLTSFFALEKEKELAALSIKENLKPEIVKKILEEHDFSGRLDADLMDAVFSEEMGLLERVERIERLTETLLCLIEKYKL